MKPLDVAIIGLGGYAQTHHRVIKELEDAGRCRLICACDPAPENFAEFVGEMEFGGRGIAVYADYQEMLDAHKDRLNLVTIPTPVPLHAPMHRAAVERGIPVYLEKPPTLDHAELSAMLAVEERAVKATNVGFNFIIEGRRRGLKERLLAGEFGAVQRLSLSAVWPRASAYFTRNDWAGRLLLNGRLVLDSCLGNAISHQAHNMLFWAGASLNVWAAPESVQAELYRGHAIESFDTVFLRARLETGVELWLAMTHAIIPGKANPHGHQELVECEKASIIYRVGSDWEVHWRDGRRESGDDVSGSPVENLGAYLDYLEGKASRPVTTLADCRPFVHLYNLAFLAAGKITTLGDQVPLPGTESESRDGTRSHIGWKWGDELISFDEIRQAVRQFGVEGRFPSEQGIAWAVPGAGAATPKDLPKLRSLIKRLVSSA